MLRATSTCAWSAWKSARKKPETNNPQRHGLRLQSAAASAPSPGQYGCVLVPAFARIRTAWRSASRRPCKTNWYPGNFCLFSQNVAVCCRSRCRFVATLVIDAQRCSRCCRFSSVYILCTTSSSFSSSQWPNARFSIKPSRTLPGCALFRPAPFRPLARTESHQIQPRFLALVSSGD